jgi:hypothetical protein
VDARKLSACGTEAGGKLAKIASKSIADARSAKRKRKRAMRDQGVTEMRRNAGMNLT